MDPSKRHHLGCHTTIAPDIVTGIHEPLHDMVAYQTAPAPNFKQAHKFQTQTCLTSAFLIDGLSAHTTTPIRIIIDVWSLIVLSERDDDEEKAKKENGKQLTELLGQFLYDIEPYPVFRFQYRTCTQIGTEDLRKKKGRQDRVSRLYVLFTKRVAC